MLLARSSHGTGKRPAHISSASARRRTRILFEALEVRQLLTVSATPIFIDNFNQSAGSLPNTSTWDYSTGTDPNNGNVDYVDNSSVMSVVNDPTASDGKALAINILAGPVVNGNPTFTSARINTSVANTVGDNLEYGMIEASIKMPGGPNGAGQGLWPAFWMLGSNFPQVGWPNSGEIDIMETKGTAPGTNQGSLHSGNLNGPRMDPTSFYNLPGGQDFYNSYHLFAVEWSPGAIQFLVDGQVYSTFLESSYSPSVWNFNGHGFYVILNINDGGAFGGPLGANSTFPQTMYVDYVAAYSLTGIGTPTNLTARAISGNQVNVSWQDPSNDATGYVLQRSTSSTFATIDTTFNLGQSVNAYTDTSATAGTIYYYRIQAVSTDGTNNYQSGYSNTATATTWFDQDIGTTGGSSSVVNDIFTQIGQGAGIGSDQFNFMSEPISGNGTVIAKLSSLNNPPTGSQAGLMMRESAATNSAFAAVLDTASNGIEFEWRAADGGTISTTSITGSVAPVWLELVRTGNSISAYYSTNDTTWIQVSVAETVVMNASVLAGMAVSSATTTTTTATFTDVSVGPNATAPTVALNSGGAAAGVYSADADFSTSTATSVAAAIDTTGVPDPAPQAVYQTNRYGGNFTYTIPGLVANDEYDVQLQFVEEFFTAAGSRIFNVSINGTGVLGAFDIFATAGAENKAVEEDFTTTADPTGTITIVFGATTNNAQVNGIQVIPLGIVSPTPAVTNLTANAKSTTENDLSWSAPTGGTPTGYNIYRGTSSGGESTTALNSTPITTTTYADTTAISGITYFYTVVAMYSAGNSGPSNEATVTTLSPIPTNLVATDKSTTEIDLTWTVPTAGPPNGYNIYRGTTSGGESATPVNSSLVTTTSYADTTVSPGITYYYTIKAVYPGGSSAASNEASAATPTTTPAPTGLGATDKSATEIDLSWTAPAGATPNGYNVYRGTTSGGESATALNSSLVTTTTYADTTDSPSTTYYYTVKAVYTAGNSLASNEAHAATTTATPAPTNLLANPTSFTQIALSWTAPTTATPNGYNVYRGTTSGGESTTALNSALITTTTYSDATAASGSRYYYTVKAVYTSGNSAASNEATATTPATATPVVAINAGGAVAGVYAADVDFTGGTAKSTTATIVTTGAADPAPQAVYQTYRYAGSFTYTIPGLVDNAAYDVQLQFAEPFWTAAGKRIFSVTVNGTADLTNFDIFAAAGGEDIAVERDFNTTANSAGTITLAFTATTDNALISGIEIIPLTTVTPSAISATPGNGTAVASGGMVTVSNTAGAGADSVTLSNIAVTTQGLNGTFGQAGLSGTAIAAGSHQTGTITYSAPGVLNGVTSTGTLAFNAAGTTVAASSGQQAYSYPLTATVSGNTGNGTANIGSGGTYGTVAAPLSISRGTGQNTSVQLLGGTASGADTVNVTFAIGSANAMSDQATITGTSSDLHVVELSYNPALLPAGSPTNSIMLGWLNSGLATPIFQTAAYGNTDGGATTHEVSGAYTTADLVLGDYGVDTTNHEAWAVVNGTGTYEVVSRFSGDVNGDGTVDTKDYDVWFSHLGQSTHLYSQGDVNGDGTIDTKDYDIWFAHLGQSVSSGQSLASLNSTQTTGTTVSSTIITTATATTPATPVVSRIVFDTAAQTLTAGVASSTMTVQLLDQDGNPINATSAVKVHLAGSSATGKFSTAGMTIAAGSSTGSFTYKDTTAGSPIITASATGLTSATQQQTVHAAAARRIVFTTATQTLTTGVASNAITVELKDAFGNVADAGASGLAITLRSTSNTGTFMPANLVIAAGTSTASFTYEDTIAGMPIITASAIGLASATQQETVTATSPIAIAAATLIRNETDNSDVAANYNNVSLIIK